MNSAGPRARNTRFKKRALGGCQSSTTGENRAQAHVDAAGVRQVTCAVYPTAIADQASEETEGGGSIQSLLDRVALHPVTPDIWSGWGEDGRSWFSVDSPETLAEATERFGG